MPEAGTTSAGFKPLSARTPPDVPASMRSRSNSCRAEEHEKCIGSNRIVVLIVAHAPAKEQR